MRVKCTCFTFLLLLVVGTGCQQANLAGQATDQACSNYIHIAITSAVTGNAQPPTACVQRDGTVIWESGPPDQAWKVQFDSSTGSPLVGDAGLNVPLSGSTPQKYSVKPDASGSFKYTSISTKSNGGASDPGIDYLEIGSTAQKRAAIKKLPTDCDNTTSGAVQTIRLSLDNSGLKTQFNHICVSQGSFISWYATRDITAWSITVRDEGLIGAKSSPLVFTPELAPPAWYGIDCRSCTGDQYHKKFSYGVTAIGTDGKVYHLDPDIIVDSGSGLNGSKGEKK